MMMMAPTQTYRRPRKPEYLMNPKKFSLWVFLVSVTMLFAAFTSALIVGRADAIEKGTWQSFPIPSAFIVSTIIIALSSVSMQWAYFAAKKDDIYQNRIMLWITLGLGIAFVVAQYIGFGQLIAEKAFFSGNAIGTSFFYVITGVHAAHAIGGIFFLLATIISSFRYRVHSRSMLRINLCATYWHFIGGLWIYLFALLSLLR
jgi:cytochrome c oxidase subunit 3